MRISILVADNSVIIDGVAHESDCSSLVGRGISALQWYGTEGEIEYAGHRKPNEQTIDLVPFREFIDRAKPLSTIAEEQLEHRRQQDPLTRGPAHTIAVLRETLGGKK